MNDEQYLRRCFDLALLGNGCVSPNPMVGAVLVYEDRIIGEGWHQKYGEAHAEVNCIRSVAPDNQRLIPYSTLYCSLEPCFHFGKTPPCVDLILEQKIPRVVISNRDPNPKVAGQSLAKLQAAGVEVISGILEAEGRWLNRAFFTWIAKHRPYIILKWAQTGDGFIGKPGERTPVSGPAALRLVHRWRSETDAILVGSTTAVTDDPRLDTRLYFGKNPLRIAFDRMGQIPADHHLLDDSTETWIFGKKREGVFSKTKFIPAEDKVPIDNLLEKLYKANRATLLVEGGANVLTQFLESGFWDEIRVIENVRRMGSGVTAPKVPADAILKEQFILGDDTVQIFARSITS
ncbi:MAG: bifunctional diaminohydroxyphosphoribosylaminopyrimidine deaminase/5-amino-6-(5-phosphoribosylamino)uracil reductase RibD [Haliscomenobacteraceae bacterium CHB4]|nr:Riboflavin biosynthesis protein RibD [Saprospiraceae bacterium]MCE7922422.1 bifunctional diaminohydroxyphosphoribosylaminopyrimidine deaminase/5-amino-6-(5-phosphoribosylamino)uracil reductase RibD [Haliscomenobacteraceae bacterium CHB4]